MASERIQRRLAAILAADAVGYSRLMREGEARTPAQLKVPRKEVFDPRTAERNGRYVVEGSVRKPHWAHPLKGVISIIFNTLDPFAKSLRRHEIADVATDPGGFPGRQETYFDGLYRKVVAERRSWT